MKFPLDTTNPRFSSRVKLEPVIDFIPKRPRLDEIDTSNIKSRTIAATDMYEELDGKVVGKFGR